MPAVLNAEDEFNFTDIYSTGYVGRVSQCMDEWNLPHIAHEKGDEIWYAHREAGDWTWSTEMLGSGTDPSVAVSPGGDPVVLPSTETMICAISGTEISPELKRVRPLLED